MFCSVIFRDPRIRIETVKLLNTEPKTTAVVQTQTQNGKLSVHTQLNDFEKSWFYLNLELIIVHDYLKKAYPAHPLHYWVDTWRLESAKWVAVVLRNLPEKSCPIKVMRNCSAEGEKVLYIEPIRLIRNWYWTIVRVGSIQDAIKIWKRLNGK